MKKILLFTMLWADDSDYEFMNEERLQQKMKPFFDYQVNHDVVYKKVFNEENFWLTPQLSIFAEFQDEAEAALFKLQFSDLIEDTQG